jgi:hydrogenase maturation factor
MNPERIGADGAAIQTERVSGCITCGDVAVWMNVLETDASRELAVCVDSEGRAETVETALVGSVLPGDALLVHAGTALRSGTRERPPR